MTISSPSTALPTVAYFSMEAGLDPAIPTYSGGLGVLAGDTLRAAADLGLPMIGVTLLHRKGYFTQHLDVHGNQTEQPAIWNPDDLLQEMTARISIQIAQRAVRIRAWRYEIVGCSGSRVPVYLLDTDLSENDQEARRLTDHLYGGDDRYRLSQEAVLGLGGVAMLRALGHRNVSVYHLNEGHAALLSLAVLDQEVWLRAGWEPTDADIDEVRRHCVFTTHTPVPAGHDQFSIDVAREILGNDRVEILEWAGCIREGVLNLTYVALQFSRYVNGVAMRHGEVARGMFPQYPVDSITNGVHAVTWVSPTFQRLFDAKIPEWRHDNLYFRYAVNLSVDDIAQAHTEAKRDLLEVVEQRSGVKLDPSVLTLGFARRATPYKRADMLFTDLDRLCRIARDHGGLQIVFGGKAHPRDEGGKALIRRVVEASEALGEDVPIVYLEDYDMTSGHLVCSGVDVWLNTPQKPLEASGTSGMKAAINGVPSFSVLDGWWIEGHVEGVTGWAIGDTRPESDTNQEVESLYSKLETVIAPLYYSNPRQFAEIGRSTIALNGSFFNAQRMLSQYLTNAYRPAAGN